MTKQHLVLPSKLQHKNISKSKWNDGNDEKSETIFSDENFSNFFRAVGKSMINNIIKIYINATSGSKRTRTNAVHIIENANLFCLKMCLQLLD